MQSGPSAAGGGIPLTEYRREVPPGWGPNIPDYPLKTYFEKLKLWYRVFDGADEVVGPLVAGRLTGRAQKIAIHLRLPRPDGTVDVGDEALVRLSTDEVRDPNDHSVILQHHIPSGVQALCNALRDAFGQSDQDMVSRSLEAFFEFRRGKLTLQEYSVEWDLRYDEAETRSNLQLNNVAKFYMFFKHSALPAKFVEDIKLQLHGDLSRFEEARSLALRLSQRGQEGSNTNDLFFGDGGDPNAEEEQPWPSDPWYDDDPWQQWYYDDEYYGEGWFEDEADGWWYGEESEEFQDARDWETSTDATTEPNTATAETAETEEYYKGGFRGRNAMKVGCNICGSKWHSSSSCPVNYPSKGKGDGGQKGHGKYRPYGKSAGEKGKRLFRPSTPWKGKSGKGYGGGKSSGKFGKKGKGKSKYYAEEWPDHQDYHMSSSRRSLDISSVKRDIPSQSSTSESRTTFYRMDSAPQEEVLKLNRTVRFAEGSPSQPEASSSKTEKVLSFAMFLGGSRESHTYHTVKGTKGRGLLIDPGAASGLIGSETLRDLVENCMTGNEAADNISWTGKTTSVAGISGQSDQTLGEVNLRLNASKRTITYKGDVLGGEGSLCPALVGNPTLRQQQAALFSDWFPNGDGLLAIHKQELLDEDRKPILLRLLLTDSGHYLLPTDRGPADVPRETHDQVFHLTTDIMEKSKILWPDEQPQINHCFLLQHDHAETDRSENIGATPQTQKAQEISRPCLTSGETCPGDRCYSKLGELGSDSVLQPVSNGAPEQTSDDEPSSPPSNKLTQPINKGNDTWSICGQWLVRTHNVPRRTMFTPHCSRTCPVPPEKILTMRKTDIKYAGGRADDVIEDMWDNPNRARNDLGQPWTGKTWFMLRDEVEEYWNSKRTLDSWMPAYLGDQFPFTDDDKVKELHREYRAMPEEFYTKTGRRPITPQNVEQWLHEIQRSGTKPTWHFLELYSGSGRLSLTLATAGLAVGCPIDLRYGWNLNDSDHQHKLWKLIEVMKPAVVFASPRCKYHSTSANTMDPGKKMKGRKEDEPGLLFTKKLFQYQSYQNRGFGAEQPWGSNVHGESTQAGRDPRMSQQTTM